jgi:hypothetical protein
MLHPLTEAAVVRSALLFAVLVACGPKDTGESALLTSDADTDTDTDTDADTDLDTDDDTGETDSDIRGDNDNDGWENVLDCDDDNPDIHPEAPELCNGVDDDCDKFIDEAPIDPLTWYADVDGDGYGGPTTAQSCEAPGGYVATYEDCNDGDDDVYPGAPEHCDGVDEDCDGTPDNDPVDPLTWYSDGDGDGYGVDGTGVMACTAPNKGDVSDAGDCDDVDPLAYPGAYEICGDAIDQDCDGSDLACE